MRKALKTKREALGLHLRKIGLKINHNAWPSDYLKPSPSSGWEYRFLPNSVGTVETKDHTTTVQHSTPTLRQPLFFVFFPLNPAFNLFFSGPWDVTGTLPTAQPVYTEKASCSPIKGMASWRRNRVWIRSSWVFSSSCSSRLGILPGGGCEGNSEE